MSCLLAAARPTLSQFWSFNIRWTTLIWTISWLWGSKIAKGPVGNFFLSLKICCSSIFSKTTICPLENWPTEDWHFNILPPLWRMSSSSPHGLKYNLWTLEVFMENLSSFVFGRGTKIWKDLQHYIIIICLVYRLKFEIFNYILYFFCCLVRLSIQKKGNLRTYVLFPPIVRQSCFECIPYNDT